MAKMNRQDILELVQEFNNRLKRARNDAEDLTSNISDIEDDIKMFYDQISGGEFDEEEEELPSEITDEA